MAAEAGDEQANEEWPEAADGAHDAGSAMWPTWPKAAIMNVTPDYPSQTDKDRLDIFWSKYKTKKKELVQSDMYISCSQPNIVNRPTHPPLEFWTDSQDPGAVEGKTTDDVFPKSLQDTR